MATKKIRFKKAMSNGEKIEAEGIPYKTKNGIDVALHKEGNWWQATEVTTGKLVTIEKHNTLKAAKTEVESNSPAVARVLKLSKKKTTNSSTRSKPDTSKPTKDKTTVAPKTTFTVKGKTFATKAEAKTYEKECRDKTGKTYVIRESKKKPSHRVVSFTAKSK